MFRPKIRFTHDEIRVLVFALNELRNSLNKDNTFNIYRISPTGEMKSEYAS